jgi:hypothetical protein
MKMTFKTASHGRPLDLHWTCTGAHFKDFMAMLVYLTKWHGTGAGGHFVKSSFKSVFHEVARD